MASKGSFDIILSELMNDSELTDDSLPNPIDPVVITRIDRATNIQETDGWMTTFLEHGANLLGDAITVAKETRSPRAIEVAHRLLKDMFVTASELNKIRKDELKENKDQSNVTDDNITLTPSQLLKMLKNTQGDDSE